MTTTHNHIASIALITASVLLLILFCAPWANAFPSGALIMGVVVTLFEVGAPIEILKYLHIRARDFNIYAHNIDTLIDLLFPPYGTKKITPNFHGIAQELTTLLKTIIAVFIPYTLGYWAFFHLLAIRNGSELFISFNLPPRLWYEIIVQIFVVALPEELFYRGFLQGALLKKWPNRHHFWGLPVGAAVIITNLFFALGHMFTSWSPLRLLTFFPGLLFSYLVYKNKSLLSAILFHAACNILGQILYASFFIK
jgi:membrane protease YdiL (CAAX protease family)